MIIKIVRVIENRKV